MVKETRIIFTLRDIKDIRIVCGNERCGAAFVPSIFGDEYRGLPEQCPQCSRQWDNSSAAGVADIKKLLRAVKALQGIYEDAPPWVSLLFEIDGDQ